MRVHIYRIAKNDQLKNRGKEYHADTDFITT